MARYVLVAVLTLLAFTRAAVDAAPVDSDLGAAMNGGGCYPPGLSVTGPTDPTLVNPVNPEWAPVVHGMEVDSDPVLIHGTVMHAHGEIGDDFPATHVRSDVVAQLQLATADTDRLAIGNVQNNKGLMNLEWEAGALPPFAWPEEGDRIVALGRWMFDCGEPGPIPGHCSMTTTQACILATDCTVPACPSCGAETCQDVHFNYTTELHPPQAMAVIRQGRGAPISRVPYAAPVLVTRADVYANADGGGAGDRCILTHRESLAELLGTNCFPLSQPVAHLNAEPFVFDMPLPPRPSKRATAAWRVIPHPEAGEVNAAVEIRPHRHAMPPYLHVELHLEHRRDGHLPTGFAGTLVAGWRRDTPPLTHVRVRIQKLIILNALKPAVPVVRPAQGWYMNAAVNGAWQQFLGVEDVQTGKGLSQDLVYEQYLPASGALRLVAQGASKACIDTLFGQSLGTDLAFLGSPDNLIACLRTVSLDVGTITLSYLGPDFGAGSDGRQEYVTPSVGGEGGACLNHLTLLCTTNADCPLGDTCSGAFALQYRIERLPSLPEVQSVGVTSNDELKPAVATARQEDGSPADVGRDLRLVH
jgi:hypothetical protein